MKDGAGFALFAIWCVIGLITAIVVISDLLIDAFLNIEILRGASLTLGAIFIGGAVVFVFYMFVLGIKDREYGHNKESWR